MYRFPGIVLLLLASAAPALLACERVPNLPARGGDQPGDGDIDCMSASCGSSLWGLADLHTHPAAHLGFGAVNGDEGIFWGAPGSSASDAAQTTAEDLAPCSTNKHSGFTLDVVNHNTRVAVLSRITDATGFPHQAAGWPSFDGWPQARSLPHQQMHIAWIHRAWQGGLRLMVASAVDNETLAMLWHRGYAMEPPSPAPTFDRDTAIVQLNLIRQMAAANASWMQIVTTPAQARAAIASHRLAVILGVEMDRLTADDILLLAQEHGVRLVTPIHLVDNEFGGAAVYDPAFNAASFFLNGRFFAVADDPSLGFRFAPHPEYLRYVSGDILSGGDLLKWGAMEPTPFGEMVYASCQGASCPGHRNHLGLRSSESLARLMAAGLLIDVAHMSMAATEQALLLAEIHGYPLLNTHTGLRPTDELAHNERQLMRAHARRLVALGGVIGLGTGAEQPASAPIATWLAAYRDALAATGGGGVVLGTDMNGFAAQIASSEVQVAYPLRVTVNQGGPAGPSPALGHLTAGTREFDLGTSGLANYGMLPDFMQAVSQLPGGSAVAQQLFQGAEASVLAWELTVRAQPGVARALAGN